MQEIRRSREIRVFFCRQPTSIGAPVSKWTEGVATILGIVPRNHLEPWDDDFMWHGGVANLVLDHLRWRGGEPSMIECHTAAANWWRDYDLVSTTRIYEKEDVTHRNSVTWHLEECTTAAADSTCEELFRDPKTPWCDAWEVMNSQHQPPSFQSYPQFRYTKTIEELHRKDHPRIRRFFDVYSMQAEFRVSGDLHEQRLYRLGERRSLDEDCLPDSLDGWENAIRKSMYNRMIASRGLQLCWVWHVHRDEWRCVCQDPFFFLDHLLRPILEYENDESVCLRVMELCRQEMKPGQQRFSDRVFELVGKRGWLRCLHWLLDQWVDLDSPRRQDGNALKRLMGCSLFWAVARGQLGCVLMLTSRNPELWRIPCIKEALRLFIRRGGSHSALALQFAFLLSSSNHKNQLSE